MSTYTVCYLCGFYGPNIRYISLHGYPRPLCKKCLKHNSTRTFRCRLDYTRVFTQPPTPRVLKQETLIGDEI